jgi:hypothetical protein
MLLGSDFLALSCGLDNTQGTKAISHVMCMFRIICFGSKQMTL